MLLRFLLALVAFHVTFLGTLAWRVSRRRPETPRPVERNVPEALPKARPVPVAEELGPDPLVDVKQRLAAARKKAGVLNPEEIRARIEVLRGRVAELVRKEDGAGLLVVMRELAKLGPEAYAAALQVASIFVEVPEGTESVFGIPVAWFRQNAFGPFPGMLRWAVEMPDLAPPWFRHVAAERLAAARGWWPERKAWLLRAVRVEDDDVLALVFADRVGDLAEPGDVNELAEIANRADGPGGRRAAARAMQALHPSLTSGAFDALMATGDAGVREEVGAWLGRDASATPAARIDRVAPLSFGERIGLRAGDVVLSLDGEPIRNPRALAAPFGEGNPLDAEHGKPRKLEIRRDGVTRTIVVRGTPGRLQPMGVTSRPDREAP